MTLCDLYLSFLLKKFLQRVFAWERPPRPRYKNVVAMGLNPRVTTMYQRLSPFFFLLFSRSRFICAPQPPFLTLPCPPPPLTLDRTIHPTISPDCYRLAAVIGCYIRGGDVNYYYVFSDRLAFPLLR